MFRINLNKIIMKTTFPLLFIFLVSVQISFAQQNSPFNGPLTRGIAPSFKAVSTNGQINFPDDYYNKWKILFSHPADFTPVCSSEILALAAMQEDFKKLSTALIVISTDGLNSHIEWIKSLETLSREGSSPVKIEFPLVTDADLSISKKFGILQQDSARSRDIRSVFIIDPENKIRAMFYYPNNVGRNIEEIKRTLIALQTGDKYDVLTPANWSPGDDVLIHSPATVQDAEKLKGKNDTNLFEMTWYMWYRKL